MKKTLMFSAAVAALGLLGGCGDSSDNSPTPVDTVAQGQEIFMTETFGNEAFFGTTLGLHEVLNNVAPQDAVELGVQVDLTKVPAGIVDVMIGSDLAAKDAALADPATTRQLIKAGAVVGVKGFYASDDPADDTLTSVGITCGLCHVTVEPTPFGLTAGDVALPIGVPQFNGVPNAGMDAGTILSLTPFAQTNGLSATLAGWGPGRFDTRALNELDDGADNPTAIPPLWNLSELQSHGYRLGWAGMFEGENAVASMAEAIYDLVMHGNGSFGTASGAIVPPALAFSPPQTVLDQLTDNPASEISPEQVLAVQAFLSSIESPAGVVSDAAQVAAGQALFSGAAGCTVCHNPDQGFISGGLHADITVTPPTGELAGGVKVPSLWGVRLTAPYFHDGSAATLADVVERFDVRGNLGLTVEEKAALVAYLQSL